jgi:hypothetical protein
MSRHMVLAALLLLAACAERAPHAGQPTPQAQSMQRMLADVQMLRAFAHGQADHGAANAAVDDLLRQSDLITPLFPPETAAQYVDLTPETARGGTAAMRAVVEPLQVAVRGGDQTRAGMLLAQVERDGCGYCHQHGY